MIPRVPIVLIVLATGLLLACRESVPIEAGEARSPTDGARVSELFAAMAAGKYADRAFPELGWDDIPALLELGPSTRMLEDIPRNPLSSQYEERCAEGLVALWLLEGVRKGRGFPSLNALCFEGKVEGSDWKLASELNHDRVLAAYRTWWARVKDLPRAEAAAIDPLEGTGLRWY